MKKKDFMIATVLLLGLSVGSCQDDGMDMPEPVPNAYQAIELTEAETRMATAGNDFAFRFFQAAESILPSQERG